jgi:hypothetical protein
LRFADGGANPAISVASVSPLPLPLPQCLSDCAWWHVYPTRFCSLTSNPVLAPIFLCPTPVAKRIGGQVYSDDFAESVTKEQPPRPVWVVPETTPALFAAELLPVRSLDADAFEEAVALISRQLRPVFLVPAVAAESICSLAIGSLFSRLSPVSVVRILSLLLLETHSIFVSSSVHFLTLSIL